MKKLFAMLITLMLLITKLPLSNTNAAENSLIYGKIEITSASKFNVNIHINTPVDVKLGAILFRIKYDNTALKYVDKSAKLSNKLSTDKIDTYDNGNTVSILSGNKLGKLLPCGDNEYITLSFKKLDDNADINIQLICEEFIDVSSNAVNFSCIESISLKTNEAIDNSKIDLNDIASSNSGSSEANNSSNSTASDNSVHNGDYENGREPSLLSVRGSSLTSMLIGGGIVLAIAVIAFWGYRAGIKTAFNMQASLAKMNNAENTDKENRKKNEKENCSENKK
ncbi:MAG: hypothetical protein ACI4II_05535 [Acutalibacteraceae bacterium]